MAQAPNRLLDEIARLVTDAAGAAQGVRREVETVVKSQFERLISEMDIAHRDDVEALREIAIKAREETEGLKARVRALEEKLGMASPEAGSAQTSPPDSGDDLAGGAGAQLHAGP